MNSPVMVTMDTKRMFEELYALIYEPFRAALLHREYSDRYSDNPRVLIQSIANVFLNDIPGFRNKIQRVIDIHIDDDPQLRSPRHNVYSPEVAKEMVKDIGRKAWRERYQGKVRAELAVQELNVSMYQIRHPRNFSQLIHE